MLLLLLRVREAAPARKFKVAASCAAYTHAPNMAFYSAALMCRSSSNKTKPILTRRIKLSTRCRRHLQQLCDATAIHRSLDDGGEGLESWFNGGLR
jgi:hypothetical protein